MSTKIKVQRICEYCGKEFTAQTIRTRYCSHMCNSRGYKANVKSLKIELSNNETKTVKNKPIEELKAKEFLTVKDVARLLNCCTRTTYRLIKRGGIKAVNLSERKTIVRRSDIDKLFA